MKALFLILISSSISFAQGNFTIEWETPADRNFEDIENYERTNQIPEIVCTDLTKTTVYVYDGNTHQLKYTLSNPDSSYFYTGGYGWLLIRPLDVNNDGIFELIATNWSYSGSTLKVINVPNGQILFQQYYPGYFVSGYPLDIDGDGYTELCVFLYENYGTFSKLIVISTTSNYIGISPNNEIVNDYKLGQNYPNPFNPNTTIEYSISKESFVKIVLYNILGSEVMTLVNEKKKPGDYKINLNAAQLSSGTYFYQILADGFANAKKMVLVK